MVDTMPSNIQEYTLGFVFTAAGVLLINKGYGQGVPELVKGKLNGLGGKLEEGEDILTSISREVEEESGLIIPAYRWLYRGRMVKPDEYIIHLASAYLPLLQQYKYNGPEGGVAVYNLATYGIYTVAPNVRELISLLKPQRDDGFITTVDLTVD